MPCPICNQDLPIAQGHTICVCCLLDKHFEELLKREAIDYPELSQFRSHPSIATTLQNRLEIWQKKKDESFFFRSYYKYNFTYESETRYATFEGDDGSCYHLDLEQKMTYLKLEDLGFVFENKKSTEEEKKQ